MMRPGKDQSSSMDFEIGSSATQKSSTKFAKNQWSGHSNDGRLVQMSQQPNKKGNDGTCHHSGMAQAGKKPPTSALPSVPAQGSVRDSINRGTQHRGGGTAMPTCGKMEFNMGRGPTKGNQQ
jgi:hypothetical protein